jgi:hypothetical protein
MPNDKYRCTHKNANDQIAVNAGELFCSATMMVARDTMAKAGQVSGRVDVRFRACSWVNAKYMSPTYRKCQGSKRILAYELVRLC